MTRNHWSTFLIAPPPSAENAWSWRSPDTSAPSHRWVEVRHTTLRSWLAHVRKHNPAFVFKSVRHPATGMMHGEIEIKCRLRSDHIRKEANE